ncbi:hypothetical protein PsorP6_016037 [Peronosclerospora sorghi]|uniref:Uncharacterized protein n=1 Tax=Peronosclerospora sorghi TaxID=230839 RepID=A0ACC0WNN2_9STRA|nr:hypothetical protein PsorP6_016037 [Peronosclerospora sorghi]
MSELYVNSVCLSPMVRSGTLPLRLLSLRYGADLVYGEEIIDKRIISAVRVPNAILNSVDFVSRKGDSIIFRTCPEEAGKVVFQIGTADPVLALKAAETVARDVAAVDVNMGCPKHFSIQGGMGAALLQKPEVACDIDTAKRLENAGAYAVGVHMRQIHERPHDKASWEKLAPVVSALSVPVLANGDVFKYENIEELRKISGASSFLIARGALANASVFRKEGPLPVDQVVRAYLETAAEVDNVFQNTKYNVMRMIPNSLDDAYASGNHYGYAKGDHVVTVAQLAATKNSLQMYSLWDLQNSYRQCQDLFRAKAVALEKDTISNGRISKSPVLLAGADGGALQSADGEAFNDRKIRVGKPQLLCETCDVQLMSEVDAKLHYKGRKHKNVLRRQTSATISKVVAKAQLEQEPVAQVAVDKVDGTSLNSRPNALEHRTHSQEEGHDFKRLKLASEA